MTCMWIHAYVHKNPPPVLVLSFKCAEIDVLGTPDFHEFIIFRSIC